MAAHKKDPRGGAREGAGRPKGSTVSSNIAKYAQDLHKSLKLEGDITPLEYFMRMLNFVPKKRRFR